MLPNQVPFAQPTGSQNGKDRAYLQSSQERKRNLKTASLKARDSEYSGDNEKAAGLFEVWGVLKPNWKKSAVIAL